MTAVTADPDLRTRREDIIRAHVDAECRHDVPATLATFPDANYDVVPLGAHTNGAAAVSELLGQLFTAFPDFHAAPGAFHHSEDIDFVEARLTGTHRGA